jgi:hypothetical protein
VYCEERLVLHRIQIMATATQITRYPTLLQRLIQWYNYLIPFLRPENVLASSILGSAFVGVSYVISVCVKMLQKKIAMLIFTTSTITNQNSIGIKQVNGLLKSLCRDDTQLVTIRGDDGNKQASAEDDALTHDTNETLLRLDSGMPPVSVRFIPGIFDCSFFHVASKDKSQQRHWIHHIVYVWREDVGLKTVPCTLTQLLLNTY